MSTILGTRLSGRYRLEARIAAGGMSTVYRAFDETLERQVAVKLMHREVAADSAQLERFRREARSVARLSHPHIVGVIDTGDDGDPTHPRPYIVLEYVEGETLKERIRRNGRLPITEAIAYAIEIARALGLAHAQHIVHRDVKPQNVLIDHEGSAKVTDFGIARTLEEDGLTADGRVLGTTDYVSPEQALGRHVSGQSDLYSLGVVLYEMLTGEVPFTGESQVAVAMKHVREELPDVQVKRPEISAALASVVEIATAKRESDRYADDAEMIADLEDVLELETARAGGTLNAEATSVMRTLPESTQRRLPMRLRHRWYTGLLLLIVAAIVAGVLVFLANRTHHGTPGAPPQQHAPKGTPQLVTPCSTCAHDYNPDALSGPKNQHPTLDNLAIDGSPSTAWTTESYDGDVLGKPGVGLYVSYKPAVAAGSMVLHTSTPG
jgi:eukaryotic-like serine/threonine-protein kinase